MVAQVAGQPPTGQAPTGQSPTGQAPTGLASTGQAPAGSYRLLAGWVETGRAAGLAEHWARYGPNPLAAYPQRHRLIELVAAAGLRGRGGAGFPTGRKLAAVAAGRRRPVVIANGCEAEPVSDKDKVLLGCAPHLVLDGAALVAYALGADEVVVCVPAGDRLAGSLRAAIGERRDDPVPAQLVEIPPRYVASEESALVNFLNTGDARPTSKPPRPFERGVRGRPTLVGNVETLAHLALIARYGPGWFRGCGTADSPGSTLVTVSGAVRRPGVYEVALGLPLAAMLQVAGGPAGDPQAVLVGGLGGSWLPLPAAAQVPLTHRDLRTAGAGLGVAALVVLPARACGLAETARVLRYLAGQSASQCGPCMFGLPAISADLDLLAGGSARGPVLDRLGTRLARITGRGACGHPDGAVRLAGSALRVFDADLREHLGGRPCRWAGAAPVVTVGTSAEANRGVQ